MKKINIKIVILLSIIIIFSFLKCFFYYHKNNFKINTHYSINTDPSIVRIYYDPATIPTMYEVYDFINQSKDSVFFVKWGRIPELERLKKNRKNFNIMEYRTEFINKAPRNILDYRPILKYYNSHPNTKFIIHSNELWLNSILPIITHIPKEAIKEINLYEDGTYSKTYSYDIDSEKKNSIKYITDNYLSDYNLVYHIEDTDILNSPRCFLHKRCIQMKNDFKGRIVTKTSIENIRKQLNKNFKLKGEYFSVYNFDYKKYKKEMTHPFGVYAFTVYRRKTKPQQQLNFMYSIINGNLSYLVNNPNVKWFYKEHPEIHQKRNFKDTIDREHPEIKGIEKHIPMELFIMADIIPDYIAGYSSSLFYNVPKENITAYIKRPDDVYLYIIKRDKKIKLGRIFNLSDSENNIQSSLKRIISRIFVYLDK